MLKILNGSKWVDGTPTDGDRVREYIAVGTPNEHYREYTYASPQPEQKDTRLAPQMFMRRMTPEERKAIRAYSRSDSPMAEDIEDFLDLLAKARWVDITDPATIQGVEGLEILTILEAGRASEILSDVIDANELYVTS